MAVATTLSLGGPGARPPRRAAVSPRLPMAFEPNRGQADRRVHFLARGPGYGVLLTDGGAVLSVGGPTRHATVRLSLLGARRHAPVAGVRRLGGTVSYLHGADRSKWLRGLPTFGAVRYTRVWPGVDAVFDGSGGGLEYAFHVAPGADARSVALRFGGVRRLSLSRGGDLLLTVAGGTLRETRPVAFQTIAGGRHPVAGRYALLGGGRVAIRLGRHDPRYAVTIDPTLQYATYLGGTSSEIGYGISVGSDGSAYVLGQTFSADFPGTTGFAQPGRAGGFDAFVAKVNPAGNGLTYATYLGGGNTEDARGVAVDSSGNAYVSGETNSADFPGTSTSTIQANLAAGNDGFIAKLNSAGTAILFATFLGGDGTDFVSGLALGSDGVYVAGFTSSTDFPLSPLAGPPPLQSNLVGSGDDAFVTKIDTAGTKILYSTYMGGNGTSDLGNAIAVDSNGHAYVTGRTDSSDFPGASLSPIQNTNNGTDAFVAELDPNGSSIVYSTYLGGDGTDVGNGIALDSAGDAFVSGETNSPITVIPFPTTPGAYQPTLAAGTDAFAARIKAGGGSLSYSTYFGGGSFDNSHGIALDSAGDAFLVGQTSSDDFPITADAAQPIYGGPPEDGYLAEFDPTGTALTYSTYVGGSDDDYTWGVATGPAGNTYVTGQTFSTDFPATAGSFQPALSGTDDAFVVRIGGPLPPPPAPGGTTTADGVPPPTTTTTVPPPPPPLIPIALKSGNLQPISGTILVRLPGATRFVRIETLTSIPVGTLIDATNGVALLTVARDRRGHLQTGEFSRGEFYFNQHVERLRVLGKRDKKFRELVTELTMAGGGRPATCPKGSPGRIPAGQHTGHSTRRRFARYLQAQASGHFKVIGRHSSGLERGTDWLTRDGCTGTLTKVKTGSVIVTDFGKDKDLLVKAGKQYLATGRGGGR